MTLIPPSFELTFLPRNTYKPIHRVLLLLLLLLLLFVTLSAAVFLSMPWN